MARERLAPQHHEPPDAAGGDGHDGAGPEGVHHERELEELAYVADQVPAQLGMRGGQHQWAWRSVWWAGASGWPTTTSRPSDVDSTSMGVP